MPQPLGKSIAKVEREERVADAATRRRREKKRQTRDAEDDSTDGPPGWMTAATALSLAALAWSFAGLAFRCARVFHPSVGVNI